MKKISCNIIKDVLPLYLDGVVSEDTRQMVEEHLETCESCRKEASALKQDVVLPASKSVRIAETKVIEGLKKRFFKKKFIVSAVSVILTLVVLAGVYSYMTMAKECIPFDDSTFRFEERDGRIYAVLKGGKMAGAVGLDTTSVEIDGEQVNAAAFYFYSTLWSEYVEPGFTSDAEERAESSFYIGESAELERIYYGEFDLREDDPAHFLDDVSGLELVWEKE